MVKPGYKQTEVGIIPEAWDISSLAAAFPKLEAGISVNSDNTLSSEYHVLKTSAVHDGVVDVAETKPIVPQDYHRVKCPLVKGSMVISRMNTPALVGECGFVKNAKDGTYLPDRLWQVKNPPGSSFDFEWLNYLLNTKQYRDAVRATATGTSNSMKNISKERLLEIKIPHPPFDEQQHIAEILSNLDELIHLVEQQISKKKAIKQGAMQELLTGKKRLPGFSGKWKQRSFSDACEICARMVDPTQTEYANLPHIGNESIEKFTGRITHYNKVKEDQLISGKYLFGSNDVLYGKINPHFAKAAFPMFEGLCSADMYPISCKEDILPEYLLYILLSTEFTNYTVSLSKRSGIPKVNREELADYMMLLPSLDEQKEIANVLCGMDLEIDSLIQKLAKYRQVKRGMMQQLLTGKIRLV